VDWLFEHMDDADIDAPLTRDQILQLARLYATRMFLFFFFFSFPVDCLLNIFSETQPSPQASPQPSPQPQHPSPNTPTPALSDPAAEERQKKQKAIQEAVANNVCTYLVLLSSPSPSPSPSLPKMRITK
jgi:hypothetical protein